MVVGALNQACGLPIDSLLSPRNKVGNGRLLWGTKWEQLDFLVQICRALGLLSMLKVAMARKTCQKLIPAFAGITSRLVTYLA